jgi:predicted metalloprotease
MLLKRGRSSENVEDRRGQGPGSGGFTRGFRGIGIGTILLMLVALYFGIDPRIVMGVLGGLGMLGGNNAPVEYSGPVKAPPADDAQAQFVSKVLAETEDTWKDIFKSVGRTYQDPTLVLFTGMTPTACGMGQQAMGPFYCPLDQKVYVDLSFYNDLQRRFGASGEFAQAYVIAHEIGHHVQKQLGISDKVQALQQRSSQTQANQLSVRLELQADCLAGVWANHAHNSRQILEQGDIEDGLRAAAAIGDDRMQKRTQGYVVPESFTHGSSAQRVEWFKRGLQHGRVDACDTFN